MSEQAPVPSVPGGPSEEMRLTAREAEAVSAALGALSTFSLPAWVDREVLAQAREKLRGADPVSPGEGEVERSTEVPCGMCDATGVAPPPSSGACDWCDGTKTVEAMGEWVLRSRLEGVEAERDDETKLRRKAEAHVKTLQEALDAAPYPSDIGAAEARAERAVEALKHARSGVMAVNAAGFDSRRREIAAEHVNAISEALAVLDGGPDE